MKIIGLTKGYSTVVSDHRFAFLNQWKWHAALCDNSVYAMRKQWNKILKRYDTIHMHRLIMSTPKGMYTDHRDHDTLNNQDDNLRVCSPSQNGMNKRIFNKVTSKFRGVYWNKKHKRFYARIKINKITLYLGNYTNEIDAALAFNKAAILHHGEFASLNQI